MPELGTRSREAGQKFGDPLVVEPVKDPDGAVGPVEDCVNSSDLRGDPLRGRAEEFVQPLV